MSGSPARGQAAERYVARRLARRGYRILATNYRVQGGEIDIVALDGDVLVLVEVKQRTGDRYGGAEEAADARQIERILEAAEHFVAAHPDHADRLWRLDLVAITLDHGGAVLRYRHIENVIID
ncbi:MAG TPA: YraN family protein [Thermomicrobiales bacterium]|nr:YraN family protein [Thermomicrobiales bacterium]